MTRPPLPNSPAIDKAAADGTATDQRGAPRPVQYVTAVVPPVPDAPGGDGSDIGAVEVSPPRVTAGEFRYWAPPHRVVLQFNQGESVGAVAGSLAPADLVVRNVETKADVTVADVSYDPATGRATFTFDSATLPNGNYRATLAAAGIDDAGGHKPAADYVLDFFVLAGDVNRDRVVNGSDFALLASNFGRTGQNIRQRRPER